METIEGEIVETTSQTAASPPQRALAVRGTNEMATWTPSFAMGIDEAVERVGAKHEFFRRVMREGDHYGIIPGTKSKPTLLKSGAELLLASMGLHAEFSDEGEPETDLTGERHGGEPYIAYRRQCTIYRQTGTLEREKMVIARASGFCSSWESKYRWRQSERTCPACGASAIIKGKEEYGGGWLCFGKKGGCGAKYADNDAAIISQDIGRIPNPDIADLQNTFLKMSDKRALVAAALIATGCSDIFTQDIEDAEAPQPRTPQREAAPTESAAKPRVPTGAQIRSLYAEVRAARPDLKLPEDAREWAAGNVPGFNAQRTTGAMLVAMDAMLHPLLASPPVQASAPTPTPLSDGMRKHLMDALARIGIKSREHRLAYAAERGIRVASFSELTEEQAHALAEDATNAARCPACGEVQPGAHLGGCPECEAAL